MSTFALAHFEAVKGRIKFFKLVIDGTCQFDQFCRDVEYNGNLQKELKTLVARMDQVANMKLLPQDKFKEITPAKESVKEYEVKSRNLRAYPIKDEGGHMIILAGKKNTKRSDINEFQSIKKQYLEYKNATK
jgi:hypothetical protein